MCMIVLYHQKVLSGSQVHFWRLDQYCYLHLVSCPYASMCQSKQSIFNNDFDGIYTEVFAVCPCTEGWVLLFCPCRATIAELPNRSVSLTAG